MKKASKYIILGLVIVLIIFGIIFYYKKNYSTVAVFINDTEKVQIYKVRNGKTLKNLDNPSMEGYAFAGWYNYETNEEFDFNTKITEDIVLVAKWAKIIIQE